jgi:hypothetical protein
MAAPTTAARVKKTLANPEPSTHGPGNTIGTLRRVRFNSTAIPPEPATVTSGASATNSIAYLRIVLLQRTSIPSILLGMEVLRKKLGGQLATQTGFLRLAIYYSAGRGEL